MTAQDTKTMILQFMAATIAVTEGVSPESLLQSDEQWNRYISHAHLIYDRLEDSETAAHFGAPTLQLFPCAGCGARFDTETAAALCIEMHPRGQ